MISPADCSERIADSRPEPGPLTRTATFCKPRSIAALAAFAAACPAANGVLLREPLNPTRPQVAQVMTLPKLSVNVMMVLLKEALICATPTASTFSFFFVRFFSVFAKGVKLP